MYPAKELKERRREKVSDERKKKNKGEKVWRKRGNCSRRGRKDEHLS